MLAAPTTADCSDGLPNGDRRISKEGRSMKKMTSVGIATTSLVLTFITGTLFFVGHTQTLPAPTVDNVRFPSGYQATYILFYTFDNYQNRQIRKVYGNDVAASVNPGQVFNFPYGSIILFESYTVQEDPAGEPVLDSN